MLLFQLPALTLWTANQAPKTIMHSLQAMNFFIFDLSPTVINASQVGRFFSDNQISKNSLLKF